MGYRGVVKGRLVVLENAVELAEGTQVEVTPIVTAAKDSPRCTPANLGDQMCQMRVGTL